MSGADGAGRGSPGPARSIPANTRSRGAPGSPWRTSADERALDALRLLLLPGLGEKTLKALAGRYGGPDRIIAALKSRQEIHPPPEAHPPAWRRALSRARAALGSPGALESARHVLADAHRAGARVIALGDEAYPDRLRQLVDPPWVLFARGRPALMRRRCVAVVGTRRATSYGEDVTRSVASLLATEGLVVVSGLARGIDSFAHEEALAGGTIGVLGCGIDVVYPRRNGALQRAIAETGLLLSEFPPGTPPVAHNFPRRNRIIAALADLVLVVEAPEKSGALITVRHALDLGRGVMAVPGLVGRASAAGVNRLVAEGAAVLTEPADVLWELGIEPSRRPPTPDSAPPHLRPEAAKVWEALHQEAGHVDDLAVRTGLSTAATLHALLELELAGHARDLGGKRYERRLTA